MRVMILGGSGMLGQALVEEGQNRGHHIISDRVELTDWQALVWHLYNHRPEIVINTAALINLKTCESNPELAHDINAKPVAWMADYLGTLKTPPKLVQISSDQCGRAASRYAISKQNGELFALNYRNALVIRTNIVGMKNMNWAFEAIENDKPMTLFGDYFTSSIDIWSFSKILFDLLEHAPDLTGILNIGSRTVNSKKKFIEALAAEMGKILTQTTVGSVKDIKDGVERATDCGLNVSPVEALLGYPMPSLADVISTLAERRKILCTNPSLLAVG